MVPSPWPSLVRLLPWLVGRPLSGLIGLVGGPSFRTRWWTLFLDSLVDLTGCWWTHPGSLVDPPCWLVGGPFSLACWWTLLPDSLLLPWLFGSSSFIL
ncbi:hypothetical protein BDR04DRAFT_1086606, partial [Suillus decipiens]